MTPAEYAVEIESSLNRMYEDHMATFESLLNSDSYDSFFLTITESQDQKEGLLTRLLKSIQNFLSNIITKFTQMIKGGSVADAHKNDSVNVDKDPNMLVRFLNGDIKSSKEYLAKAARGEISVDEAQSFVRRQQQSFDAIKATAIPAGALFAWTVANEKIFKNWKSECDQAMEDVQRADGVDYAGKVSNLMDGKNKQTTAQEASKIILAHMNTGSKTLMDTIIGPLKGLYQKGYMTNKILDDAAQRNDKNYSKRLARENRRNTKAAKAQERQLYKDKANRDANSVAKRNSMDVNYSNQNRVNRAVRDTFDDTKDTYVDDAAIRK